MASPQRQDPRNDPRNYPPQEKGPVVNTQRRVEREVGTGGVFSLWWIWIPVAIAVFWFVGWGWGPYGGWWWGRGPASQTNSAQTSTNIALPSRRTNNAAPPNGNRAATGGIAPSVSRVVPGTATGTGLAVLESPDKTNFIGQPFNIDDVQVLKKAGPRAFWIGTPTAAAAGNATYASSILLILPKSLNMAPRPGQYMDVSGTVRAAPPKTQARRDWSLSSGNAGQLEINKAYIQGANVVVVNPGATSH